MRTSVRSAHRATRLNCETLEDRVTPVLAFALSGTSLLSFDTATPATTTTTVITGVPVTDTLVGIDIRPVNGQLYALGVNVAGAGTLYTIATPTGVASVVGTAGSIIPTAPLPNPVLVTSGYGFDFNPQVDLIRVVTTNGQNLRVNPISGLVQGNDTALNAGSTTADGSAYTNNAPGVTATTLYTIDAATDQLYIQGAVNPPGPNGGVLTAQGAALGVNIGVVNGFDIPAGVTVGTSGTAAAGLGFLAATVGVTTNLYTVDLTTGVAGAGVAIGTGALPIRGLAVTTGGTVSFQSATVTSNEGTAGVNVVLTRTGGTNPQTVTVTVTGGTATAGVDFPSGPYTVSFVNGATTATLNIPFVSDGVPEGSETVNLAITGVSNGLVGAQATTTLSVGDTVERFGRAFGTGSVVPAVAVIASGSTTVTTLFPYATGAASGVRVAVGDVTGDGINDLVTVPTVGAPLIKVFSGADGSQVASFLAYPASFNIPATVAVGDVNNDGFDDIIVGTATTLSAILVFDGQTFGQAGIFLPFGTVPVGVNVATGDVDGNGQLDIIAGTVSGLAVVGVFNGQTFAQQQLFLPFDSFTGGATVASGDLDGDGSDEIIVGTASVVPAFGVYKGANQTTVFFPFANFAANAGANVAVGDVNGDGRLDIIAGQTIGLAATAAFDGSNLSTLNQLLPFGGFNGGVFVG